MTDNGILELVDRLCGTYPLQYKGFSQDEMRRITNEAKRNFQAFTDDEVFDALTAYINNPDSKMPPSPGQLKGMMHKKTEDNIERDWDKTRLVFDDEGRLFYNQLYEKATSSTDPGRKVIKPLPNTRPFDGAKDYHPVHVPLTDDELVAICKKRGWEYKITETPEGKKRYTYDQKLYEYVGFVHSSYDMGIDANKVFRRV